MRLLVDTLFAPPQFADPETFQENHLKQRVVSCLKSRLPGPVANVEITVLGRIVIFRGDALSAEEKRLCYECCRHVPGVRKVVEKSVAIDAPNGSQ